MVDAPQCMNGRTAAQMDAQQCVHLPLVIPDYLCRRFNE